MEQWLHLYRFAGLCLVYWFEFHKQLNCKASHKTNKCRSVVNDASGAVATNVRGLCNNQSSEILY